MFWRKVLGDWREGEAGRGAERLTVGAWVGRARVDVWDEPVSKSGAAAASPLDADCAGPSRMDGSEGGGPSMAHRRVSYLERIKDSILL